MLALLCLTLVVAAPPSAPAAAVPASSSTSQPAFPPGEDVVLPGLVDVGAKLPIHVELKYGTTDNFMHRDVYGGLKRCFLVDDAATKLSTALDLLHRFDPNLTFVTYDCARPKRVQVIMWSVVEGTGKQGYVANPNVPPGSVHNTGCAVDISLWDTKADAPVDMGTPFDFFGEAAEPRHEIELVDKKKLTYAQYANRLLLREVMVRAGFHILPHEWWHFDCVDGFSARRKYPVIP